MKTSLIPALVLAVLFSTARLYADTPAISNTGTTPANGASGLNPYNDRTFTLGFSENLSIIISSGAGSQVSVLANSKDVTDDFNLIHNNFNLDTAVLSLKSDKNLEYGTTYTLTLTGVTDSDGDNSTNLTYTFSTVAAVPPVLAAPAQYVLDGNTAPDGLVNFPNNRRLSPYVDQIYIPFTVGSPNLDPDDLIKIVTDIADDPATTNIDESENNTSFALQQYKSGAWATADVQLADPAFTVDGSNLILNLKDDGGIDERHLKYNKNSSNNNIPGHGYKIVITNLYANETVANAVSLEYEFSTKSVDNSRPKLDLANSTPLDSSPTSTPDIVNDVSPYLTKTVLAFNNNNGLGLKRETDMPGNETDNGGEEKIVVYDQPNNGSAGQVKLTYATDYNYRYDSQGRLEFTWLRPLDFNRQYQIRMNDLISNEDRNVRTNTEIVYTFRTTGDVPFFTIPDADNGQELCLEDTSAPISFTLNEGHVGNFHGSELDEWSPNNQELSLGIRKRNGTESPEGFTFALSTELSVNSGSNIANIGFAFSNENTVIMVRFSDFKGNTIPIDTDVLDVISGAFVVSVPDEKPAGVSDNDFYGTYEIYVRIRENSFRGIDEGDYIATFILNANDPTPTLQADATSPFCQGDRVTFSVDGNTSDDFLYFVTNNATETAMNATASNTVEDYEMTPGDTQIRVLTTGICSVESTLTGLTVDATAPAVLPTLSLDNGTETIGVNDNIVIQSSDVGIKLDDGSREGIELTGGTGGNIGSLLSLRPTGGGQAIGANVTIDDTKQYITIDPTDALETNTSYEIRFAQRVKRTDAPPCPDGAVSRAEETFTFTTGILPTISEDLDGGNICINEPLTLPDITILEGHRSNFAIGVTGTDEYQTITFEISSGFILANDLETTASVDLIGDTDLADVSLSRVSNRRFSVTIQRNVPTWWNAWLLPYRSYIDRITISDISMRLPSNTNATAAGTGQLTVISSDEAFEGITNNTVVADFTHIPTQQLTWISPEDDVRICEAGDVEFSVSIDGADQQGTMALAWSKDGGTASTPIPMPYDPTSRQYTFELSAGNLSGAGEYDFYATSTGTDDVCGTTIETPKELTVPEVIPDRDIVFKLVDRTAEDEYEAFNEEVRVHNQNEPFALRAFHRTLINGSVTPAVYNYEEIPGNFYDEYGVLSPIVELSEPTRPNQQAWAAINPNSTVPRKLGYYNVRFQQECRSLVTTPITPTSTEPAHFRIELYDARDSKQLDSDAIRDGVICRNLRGEYELNWVPETINSVRLDSIVPVGSAFAGFVKDSIVNNETVFFIDADILDGKTVNSLDIFIHYSVIGENNAFLGSDKELQTIVIAENNTTVSIVDQASASTLRDVYCEDERLDLVLLSSGSVIYKQGEDTLGTSASILFRESNATDDLPDPDAGDTAPTSLTSANFMPPSDTPYTLIAIHTDDNNCTQEVPFTIGSSNLPAPLDDINDPYCVGDGENGFIPQLEVTGNDPVNWYNSSGVRIGEEPTLTLNSNISNAIPSANRFNLEVVNEYGCVSEQFTYDVSVGEPPVANFRYEITSDQKVWLTDESTSASRPEDQITEWDYKLNEDELQRTTITDDYDVLQLSDHVVDSLLLVVTTEIGCKDSIKQLVTIPGYANQSNGSYSTSFEDQHGWVATTQNENTSSRVNPRNSTWELKTYNGVTTAWHASGNNESSWVESPLIDISQWPSPVISMDLNYDTPELEGIVIQYRIVGETPEQNSDWQVVGTTETGAIPYTSSGISARPGDDITGWTGQSESFYEGWITPAFELSEVKIAAINAAEAAGRPTESGLYVQFRVAYATLDIAGDNNRAGVAFDNFSVHNKSRKMLLEHYTNVHIEEIQDERRKVNAFVEERYNSSEDPDIVYIQFHLHGAGDEPINTRYYRQGSVGNLDHSIRNAPRAGGTLMNLSRHYLGEFENAVEQYGRETVQAPAFDLELTYNRDTYQPGDYLEISAKAVRNNNPLMSLDTAARPFINVLSAAIVEKRVEHDGEIHHNVLVKNVPFYGTCYKRADWGRELGDSIVLEKAGWQIPVDAEPNRFAIVAWVEKTSTNPYPGTPFFPEAFQAMQVDIDIPLYVSDPITGVNPLSSQGIKYYPVPIKDELHLTLSQITQPNTQWSMTTLTGQQVLTGSFIISDLEQVIDTQGLRSGVYLLQIEGYDKPVRVSKH